MVQITNVENQRKSLDSCADIVILPTAIDAQNAAFADASTSGARFFYCHIYEQGERTHLTFSLAFNLLLDLVRLNVPDSTKDNKANAEEFVNRPIMISHVEEIKKYLLETDKYILPPFTFNTDTPIKVFAFGSGSIKVGYAVIPSNLKLYVTDGQHRIKAIKEAIKHRPSLKDDGATVLVVHEKDLDQIHQDFADCAKTKAISPALITAFDVGDVVARLTRELAKESDLFKGRIDQTSRTVGKDPNYLFTMNQLRVCTAELLFGSSRKQVVKSRSTKIDGDEKKFREYLEIAKNFYLEFANNNAVWKQLLDSKHSSEVNLYNLRKARIDFSTVGFQIISKLGHHVFYTLKHTDEEREKLIKAIAKLDYSREGQLWQGSVLIEDKDGDKTIVTNIDAVEKAFRDAAKAIEQQTGISLVS